MTKKESPTAIPPLDAAWPAVPLDDWLALLESDPRTPSAERLASTTEDGLRREPLRTPDNPGVDGTPAPIALSRPPATRWRIESTIRDLTPGDAASSIRTARRLGAQVFRIRLDGDLRRGRDPDTSTRQDSDALPAFCTADFGMLTAAAGPDGELAIDAGMATPFAIAVAAAARGQADGPALRADADPVTSALVDRPALPLDRSLDATFGLLASPVPTILTLRADRLHDAGATTGQSIAGALALLAFTLREAEARGHAPETVLPRLAVRVAVGRDLFESIAGLRALHLTWTRLAVACGVPEEAATPEVFAVTASRSRSRRDAWVNLLRNTGDLFAAAIGGASAIDVLPMDAAQGRQSPLANRMAINAQRILAEESHLAHVGDPAAGSWAVEAETRAVAEHAWSLFQDTERDGGVLAALGEQGALRAAIAEAASARANRVAHGRMSITGVNAFPDLDERALPGEPPAGLSGAERRDRCRAWREAHPAAVALADVDLATHAGRVEAARRGATMEAVVSAGCAGGEMLDLPALPAGVDAAVFEELRDEAEAMAEQAGSPPRALVVPLGPLAGHRARTLFTSAFLAAGGIHARTVEGAETPADVQAVWEGERVPLVVLSGPEALWEEQGLAVARVLAAAGVRDLVVAGRPGELETAFREAGVTAFLYAGGPMAPLLRGWLEHQGGE